VGVRYRCATTNSANLSFFFSFPFLKCFICNNTSMNDDSYEN
jgi:hypothetical protein